MKEYSDFSTRGKSELTTDLDNKTSGLDKNYATQYSYAKLETFNLFIPRFMGGGTVEELGLWSFDGSSTEQAAGELDVLLNKLLRIGEIKLLLKRLRISVLLFSFYFF